MGTFGLALTGSTHGATRHCFLQANPDQPDSQELSPLLARVLAMGPLLNDPGNCRSMHWRLCKVASGAPENATSAGGLLPHRG